MRDAPSSPECSATDLNSLKRRKLVQIAEETVRERGLIAGQIEAPYRQQLKSKLDWNLVRVELVNAESFLVRSRNDLKSSYGDPNRAMGLAGQDDYASEDIAIDVKPTRPLDSLINDSWSHPESNVSRNKRASAEAKLRSTKKQIFLDHLCDRQRRNI